MWKIKFANNNSNTINLHQMTQKEILESLTGEKMPDPTPQDNYRKLLPNTPFWVIGGPENGYNIIMGKWKLTKEPICKNIDNIDEESRLQSLLLLDSSSKRNQ